MKSFISLSKRTLLYPYSAPLLFLLIAIIDTYVFHGALKHILPTTISAIFLYYALSEFPHIVASLFLLGDKEYLKVYKPILLQKTIPFILGGFILYFTAPPLFYLFYITSTLYHVIMQQFGIAKMYGIRPSVFLTSVRYFFIAIGVVLLTSCVMHIPASILITVMYLMCASCIFYFVFEKENRKNTSLTLFMTMFTVATILFAYGYPLLGLMSIRIIHDISAFMFYCTHNYNRQLESYNPIFNSILTKKLNPFLLTIVIALFVNFLFLLGMKVTEQKSTEQSLLILFYLLTTLTHFHIEGFIWKRDSATRKYIQIY